ncbi:uncharacterized protein LOC114835376 [Esox lucius]|uniref:uncharacterized protein LOC114835376 n=1 Tax=Esox lucius TaxID=8010 RepID=UPI0014769B92|nr:uncharacterized protein LOC114835376 [Esox lucius]
MNLDEQEMEQLARFIGHDIRVHCDYYRKTDKTFQVAKISKLLLAMEQGTGALMGNNLDTLDSLMNNSPVSTSSTKRNNSSPIINLNSQEDHAVPEDNAPKRPKKNNKSKHDSLDHADHSSSSSSNGITEEAAADGPKKKMCKTSNEDNTATLSSDLKADVTPQKPRRLWSTEEKAAVTKHLAKFLALRRVPGKGPCILCIENEEVLKNRSWKDIKFFMHNSIISLNKKMTQCPKK